MSQSSPGQPASASAELLERLVRYLEPFREEFRRQDQVRRAAAYLFGLLQPGERRNIENLARIIQLPESWGVTDVAQALQHFVNQSPWNDEAVARRHLQRRAARADGQGVLVVAEQTFVKQGRHSVGVQRQFSSVLGRKVNCQLAVALHHASTRSFLPLGLRLYLPRLWLQDEARLKSAGVPAEVRFASKSAIALELIDRAREIGVPARGVVLSARTSIVEELRTGLASRGLEYLEALPAELQDVLAQGERHLLDKLGLDHFEGRSWRGFHHHACLVLLAHGFQSGRR